MSFDLYFWGSPKPVTTEQAAQICQNLAQEQTRDVHADPQVEAFYQQIIARFPALEGLGDDDLEASPWSMSPQPSPSHLITSVRWPQAEEFARWAIPLAAGYGLVCYDPQGGQVHNPPAPSPAGHLRLEFCDGGVIDDPSPTELPGLLNLISDSNWYACLQGRPGWFVQVGIGPRAGAPDGQYAVEFREGTPDRHYRTVLGGLDEVASVFHGFATADQSWKDSVAWTRLSF